MGSNNSPGRNPGTLAMRPGGEEDVPLALWTGEDLSSNRPINVTINVQPAAMVPGGEQDLPLNYWVGASDFTTSGWKWFGPYSASKSIELNSAAQRNRFISSAGRMSVVVLCDQSYSACGAEVQSISISQRSATDPSYLSTLPCTPTLLPPLLGSGATVTLSWIHCSDPVNNSVNEAVLYKVYRKAAGESTSALIGTVAAPLATYNDPANNISGIPAPSAGQTYTYYLMASNAAGATPLAAFAPVTLAP